MPTPRVRHVPRTLIMASAVTIAAIAAISTVPGAQAAARHHAGGPLLSSSQPAPAGVKPIHRGTGYRPATAATRNTLALQTSNATGAVSPTPTVYLVFWGSQWTTSDPARVAPDMQAMFNGLDGTSDTWGTILDQYCEGLAKGTTNCGASGTHVTHPASSPLAGVWFDNAAPAPSSATVAQLAGEAAAAAGHFGNTTQTPNLNAQYVILSPTGTHPDGFPNTGFCGWHNFTSTSLGKLAYTNLPYVPDLGTGACTTLTDGRLLDGIESTETHEYAETVTDFFPSTGWTNTRGSEIGDECVNLDATIALSTGTFDVQGLWSNSAAKCVTHG